MANERYIAYVEDDEDDVLLLQECLKTVTGVTLLHFTEGKALIHFLEGLSPSDHPSFILMDRVMPGLSVEETISRLKDMGLFPGIPVAVLSTTASRKDAEVYKNLDVQLFIKPSTYEGWANLCEELLEKVG